MLLWEVLNPLWNMSTKPEGATNEGKWDFIYIDLIVEMKQFLQHSRGSSFVLIHLINYPFNYVKVYFIYITNVFCLCSIENTWFLIDFIYCGWLLLRRVEFLCLIEHSSQKVLYGVTEDTVLLLFLRSCRAEEGLRGWWIAIDNVFDSRGWW